MEKTIHLIVTEGPAIRRELHVPPGGLRLGRSSRNDLSIADEAMSRFQCRFFFKPGEGLWVSDLGSANGTLVNDVLVQEQRLKLNDEVLAGDTRFRVVSTGEVDTSPVSAPGTVAPYEEESPKSPVAEPIPDLGLHKGGVPVGPASANALRRKLIWVAGGMMAVAVLVWLGKTVDVHSWFRPVAAASSPEVLSDLDLSFERVEGTSSNIFRYFLEVENSTLTVQVDDLQSNRHVRREKKVAPELLRDLARSLEASGFFDLQDDYSGLAPGIYDSSDLSVTISAKTRRVRVLNRIEPEVFASARAMIEEFGKNELGLAALAIDPASLVEKAKASLLQGKKMRDEREVRDENLFNAIKAFKECEWYVETIEPKPEFYAEAMAAKTDCERELQRRFDDIWFVAERAVKLRDWKEADRQLKTICEMIPDRSDDRNRNASKKLVDVERHLATEK